VRTRRGAGGAGEPWGSRRCLVGRAAGLGLAGCDTDGGPGSPLGRRGPGCRGEPGSVFEPPSSSEVPGGAFIASSSRNGSHSISAAIGSLISPNSSTIDIHSDISVAMLLLLCAIARRDGSCRVGR
jgi:hypothetical protein